MDLELEVRGRRRRRDHGESPEGFVNIGDSHGEASYQSGSRQSRERLRDFADRMSTFPERHRHRSAVMDAMSRALCRVARSPFSDEIERAQMPQRFNRLPFVSYDGKADLVEHVSHYIQMLSMYSQNDALICKVFLSSLGPTALRWFNGLKKGSIHNFEELIQELGAWFMTCSRVSQPVDALLSMKMRGGETLWNYSNRYWELYNEIGGGNEKVATSIFIITRLVDHKAS